MKPLWLAILIFFSSRAVAQGVELSPLQETYRGKIGETLKAPLRFRNTTDKPLILIIRKVSAQIGSTQKNYYCLDNNCLDTRVEDYTLKIEPGQTFSSVTIALDAGLVSGESTVRYIAFNKFNPNDFFEFDINFLVEEHSEKPKIYSSRYITIHDVFPNPAIDHANVDYRLQNDLVKARITIHNILGNIIAEYALPNSEHVVKMRTDDLRPGIYFYTLYVDNESVMTRKLLVK